MSDELEHEHLSGRLGEATPRLAPEFRAWLARHLADNDDGYGPLPSALRLRVGAMVASGGLLLALGALQATGSL